MGVGDDDRAVEIGIGVRNTREICVLELIVDDDDVIGSGDEQTRAQQVAECVGVENQALVNRDHRFHIFGALQDGHFDGPIAHIGIGGKSCAWKTADVRKSVATKASSSSFLKDVEKLGVVTVELAEGKSVEVFTSMPKTLDSGIAVKFMAATLAPFTTTD